MLEKERICWIDIAKGFFIIAIVLGHIFSNGENLFRWWLFSFHVPAFFFLSGLCFNNQGNDTVFFIKKRIKRIVVPYASMSLFSIVVFYVGGFFVPRVNEFVNGPIQNILALLYSNSNLFSMKYNLPLWFLPCLFSTEILAYFARRVIDKITYKVVGYISLMLVAVAISIAPKVYLPWHLETAGAMLFWFTLGMMIRDLKPSFLTQRVSKKHLLIVLVTILLGCGISFLNVHNVSVRRDMYGIYYNYYLSALLSVFGFCLFAIIIEHNQLLEYIGKNSLVILLLHKYPILLFQDLLPWFDEYLDGKISFVGIIVGFINT